MRSQRKIQQHGWTCCARSTPFLRRQQSALQPRGHGPFAPQDLQPGAMGESPEHQHKDTCPGTFCSDIVAQCWNIKMVTLQWKLKPWLVCTSLSRSSPKPWLMEPSGTAMATLRHHLQKNNQPQAQRLRWSPSQASQMMSPPRSRPQSDDCT